MPQIVIESFCRIDLAVANAHAFNEASAMPLQTLQEARTLIGHLVETAAPWSEARRALQEWIDAPGKDQPALA